MRIKFEFQGMRMVADATRAGGGRTFEIKTLTHIGTKGVETDCTFLLRSSGALPDAIYSAVDQIIESVVAS